jgi:hypothetical protein
MLLKKDLRPGARLFVYRFRLSRTLLRPKDIDEHLLRQHQTV